MHAIGSIAEAIALLDHSGLSTIVNKQWVQQFGFTQRDCSCKPFTMLFGKLTTLNTVEQFSLCIREHKGPTLMLPLYQAGVTIVLLATMPGQVVKFASLSEDMSCLFPCKPQKELRIDTWLRRRIHKRTPPTTRAQTRWKSEVLDSADDRRPASY
jgi:hypothetical protein